MIQKCSRCFFRVGEKIGVLRRKFGSLRNDGSVGVFASMGDLQV